MVTFCCYEPAREDPFPADFQREQKGEEEDEDGGRGERRGEEREGERRERHGRAASAHVPWGRGVTCWPRLGTQPVTSWCASQRHPLRRLARAQARSAACALSRRPLWILGLRPPTPPHPCPAAGTHLGLGVQVGAGGPVQHGHLAEERQQQVRVPVSLGAPAGLGEEGRGSAGSAVSATLGPPPMRGRETPRDPAACTQGPPQGDRARLRSPWVAEVRAHVPEAS